jgi:TFIIF-interacting CTD phosphatase-like protein
MSSQGQSTPSCMHLPRCLHVYRPGWKEFLRETATKYEMHVYTMGTRAYAEEVCAAIDPDGSIFGGRLLSRDESGSKFSGS